MVRQEYTPFMTSAADKISQGLMMRNQKRQEQETGRLMGDAMMGDPQALENLYMYSPKLAAEVQQRNEQMASGARQAAMQKKIDFQNKADEFFQEAYAAPDYETAKATLLERISPWSDIYETDRIVAERFTPEVYETGKSTLLSKTQASANANRVVNTAELGGGAMQITYANGRTEVITPSDEQRQAIKLAQQEQITFEEALNQARGRGRTVGGIEGELSLSEEVAKAEAERAAAIAESRTAAEYEQKLKNEPILRNKIAAATKRGQLLGEAEAGLEEQQANFPMLVETVDILRGLSDEATYTTMGKARNLIYKELGVDVPEGAKARVAYQTTVDNVVLPLLRATFGAAFTEREGARLAATLGDVDLSPSEKQIALDSFIQQRALQLQKAKDRASGQQQPAKNIDDMTEEELDEFLSQ